MPDLAAGLANIVGAAHVSTSAPDRASYARDLWPRGLLGVRAGELAPCPPDVIVWPETTSQVQQIVRFAVENRVPIVPFGAGSGVCGGAVPLHGGIVVDMKRMARLVEFRPDEMEATFETGINGEHLEHELARRGYTLGHFPSSIMCSTLGGWLAARSAGQTSSRYGKIEDMVRRAEVVVGTGEAVTLDAGATGPDLLQILVGSEGTLGIFTRATLRIRKQPAERVMRGWSFPRVAAGTEAMRRVMQRGLRPSVLRLYDELDTFVARRSAKKESAPAVVEGSAIDEWLAVLSQSASRRTLPELKRWLTGLALDRPKILNRLVDRFMPSLSGGCLLVVGVEGDHALVDAEYRAVARELEAAGGTDLGPGPGERWLRNRYAISFNLSKIFDAGAFADTMEVATTWEQLMPLYDAVRAAVSPHAFVMAHFSHAYPEGCSIYFTFAAAVPGGKAARAAAERRYDDIWRAGLAAVTSVGATISHHHGVGLLKAGFMPEEHGAALEVLRAAKAALDPHGVFNPGKLGLAPPSLPAEEARA